MDIVLGPAIVEVGENGVLGRCRVGSDVVGDNG